MTFLPGSRPLPDACRLQITILNLHPPADGSLARDDVTLAVVEAEVGAQLADALAGQAVHAEVARVADALGLPGPLVDLALGVLVTGLELTGVRLVTCKSTTLNPGLLGHARAKQGFIFSGVREALFVKVKMSR